VPTSGELIIDDLSPWKNRGKYVAEIGAVFGQRTSLWWDLPLIESMDLLRYIYKIPRAQFKQNLNEYRELLELVPFLETPVRALSLGQRMRADICAVLMHDLKLLFLDEPTIGLDVVAKDRIQRFLRHINQAHGTTILLTTHDLSDVENLCERVLIIDHGKLLYDGKLDLLRERFGDKRKLIVEFAEDDQFEPINGVEITKQQGSSVTFQFTNHDISAFNLINLLSAQYKIHDIEVR
jgi:ABC-2 type transport system ATP-binding protein